VLLTIIWRPEGACKILDPSMENRTGMGKSFGKRGDRESCKKTLAVLEKEGEEMRQRGMSCYLKEKIDTSTRGSH
jgi:hypothetical protein